MADYKIVDGRDEYAWLASDLVFEGDFGQGCWKRGFEDVVRIPHAMWRDLTVSTTETHDEREKRIMKEQGKTPTTPLEKILAQATTFSVGAPAERENSLVRVRWADYAREHGGTADFGRRLYPIYQLSASGRPDSLEANIYGPAEGCLDRAQASALIETLLTQYGDQKVFKHTTWQWWRRAERRKSQQPVMRTTLGKLLQTYDAPEIDGDGFGQNVWPEDRGWLTHTDYDSPHTEVAGPRELIEALRQSPELETYDVDVDMILNERAEVIRRRRDADEG